MKPSENAEGVHFHGTSERLLRMELQMPAVFQEAKREQQSFLAPLEKRSLIWMAQRAPRWINSDHLTLLGLVSLFGAGVSY